jgi:DNA primase
MVAGVYSVRRGGLVSTPLTWDELRPGLDPAALTIDTVPAPRRPPR